jgi:hypothetical protein
MKQLLDNGFLTISQRLLAGNRPIFEGPDLPAKLAT